MIKIALAIPRAVMPVLFLIIGTYWTTNVRFVFEPVKAEQAEHTEITVLKPQNQTSRPTKNVIAIENQGIVITQSFTLKAGWNSIYLEVEPMNPSPLINAGSEQDPIWIHELSSIDAILGSISGLEEVWGWNVPQSTEDYIADPNEERWDKPGWKRYISESIIDGDDQSQVTQTDLVNLHANRGYLIKMADGTPETTLALAGTPKVEKHRWISGAYNLSGFPILPDAAPTERAFFADSPISEVWAYSRDGEWRRMAETEPLAYGQAYMVLYDDSDAAAANDYTAPLEIVEPLLDGLDFSPGFGGRKGGFRITNHSADDIDVSLSLLDGSNVALHLISPVDQALATESAIIRLDARSAKDLNFVVRSIEQMENGEGILAIASSDLGVRWLVPVTALSGNQAGLWIGDVTVNDVSESRLGATNVAEGSLTVALRSRNESGIDGAVLLQERIEGTDASVNVSIALNLPEVALVEPTVLTGTPPFVTGHLFVDLNQNGQRDGDEPGLPNQQVTLGGATAQTGDDGSYLFEGTGSREESISVSSPAGYTVDFPVRLPDGTDVDNVWPAEITLGEAHISAVEPAAYLQQILPPGQRTLPVLDQADNRVDPPINFGVVAEHRASLWKTGAGGCGQLLGTGPARELGQIQNGFLNLELERASLNPPPGQVEDQLLGAGTRYAVIITDQITDNQLSCGEIVVGSPTRLADGRGSEFSFRVILRVGEDGTTELLPYYENGQGTRVSSANFSMRESIRAIGKISDPDAQLAFNLVVAPDDARNPFKHKYHPDHDNLDRQFLPFNLDTVNPNLWESYEVRRILRLSMVERLSDIPAFSTRSLDEIEEFETNVDWGGATWGGLYQEVIGGVHKNDITVQGHFIVRHVLQAEEMEAQSYDQ